MARIIRAGKTIIKIIIPLIVLSIILYSTYLLTYAKADIAQPSVSSKVPVWIENISQREKNTRIWEITKWQKKNNHVTGEPNIVEVKSIVREKGCGACYKDSNDNWQITDTSWRQTATGFVMDKANYTLEIGKTDCQLNYKIGSDVLTLKADSIKLNDLTFASIAIDINGYIDSKNKSKIVYPNAFGEGIDLEIEAEPDGFHQNVVFKNKLKLPEELDSENTEIKLTTEIIGVLPQRPQRCNLKDDIKLVNHRFVNSKILQTKNGNIQSFSEADKQIIEDDGKNYLVESLKFSELQNANYPVVWDYHNVNGTITEDEEWYADATYYINGTIYLSNGAELKIEHGTIIKFNEDGCINAESGKLTAQGKSYEYIIFTSKNDNTCGETITGSSGSPIRGCWIGLYLSDDDIITFCKIGYAECSLQVSWQGQASGTIENNIIYNFNSIGAGLGTGSAASGTYNIKNNLIYNDSQEFDTIGIFLTASNTSGANALICNNTIAKSYWSIICQGSGGSTDIKNNLITDCPDAIVGYDFDMQAVNNGFCDAQEFGSDYVYCGVSPYDNTHMQLGLFFLNNAPYGGALLKNAGDGDVGLYYENPNAWSIYPVSDVEHLFTSDTSLSSDTTWQPNYETCDTGTVAIGYHHPRIDYCINNYALRLDEYNLIVESGTVIAINKSIGSYQTDGLVNCKGKALEDRRIKFVYTPDISMDWQQHCMISERPILQIWNHNDNNSNFEFTDFIGIGLNFYGTKILNPIHDCQFNYKGMYVLNSDFALRNCIFKYCTQFDGLYCENWTSEKNVYIENCNFDRNLYAVEFNSEGDSTLTIKNSVFTNNYIGIYFDSMGAGGGYLVENYNAFYANVTNIEAGIPDQTDYTGSPYVSGTEIAAGDFFSGWEKFEDRFYLPQDSVLVDGGDPTDGPMERYTTDPTAISNPENATIDTNRRDVGYHYPQTMQLYAGGSVNSDGLGGVVYQWQPSEALWQPISEEIGEAVLCLCWHNGTIYAGIRPYNPWSKDKIYRWDGGMTWTRVSNDDDWEWDPQGETGIYEAPSLIEYQGDLYAGTEFPASLYKYNNATETWTKICSLPTSSWDGVKSLYEWDGYLYLGDIFSDCIARYKPDEPTPLQQVQNEWGSCIWDFQAYQNRLYASAMYGRIYRSAVNDGSETGWLPPGHWKQNVGSCAWELELYQDKLFIGSDSHLFYYEEGQTSDPVSCWQIPEEDRQNGEHIVSMLSAGDYLYIGIGSEWANYEDGEYSLSSSTVGNVYCYDGTGYPQPMSEGLNTSGIQCFLKVNVEP